MRRNASPRRSHSMQPDTIVDPTCREKTRSSKRDKVIGQLYLFLDALLLVFLLPALPFLWPCLELRRRKRLHGPNGGHRQRARPPSNGRMVSTSHGETFVMEVQGPQKHKTREPLVVLVHGNVGSTRYLDEVAERLAAAGRRVLRYDLYGRGYSACGGWDHTWQLFVSQLAEILFEHQAPLPVDVVGYSIGAQIAAHFAATHAHAVRRLVLLCPALLVSNWISRLFQMDVVRSLAGRGMCHLLRDCGTYASDWVHLPCASSLARLASLHPIERDRMIHEPAISRTFGLSVACMPWDESPQTWTRLAQSDVEIHAVCCVKDTVARGPEVAVWLRQKLGPRLASLDVLTSHGHSLPYESPDDCSAILLAKLGAASRSTFGGREVA